MDTNNGLRFTRADLLMGAGVACLAILLLIPMIVSSRETARRAQCANNLRQVGIALQSYLEINQSLPYAARWTTEDLPAKGHWIGAQDRSRDP